MSPGRCPDKERPWQRTDATDTDKSPERTPKLVFSIKVNNFLVEFRFYEFVVGVGTHKCKFDRKYLYIFEYKLERCLHLHKDGDLHVYGL